MVMELYITCDIMILLCPLYKPLTLVRIRNDGGSNQVPTRA